ncbi:MAG: HAD family hydrolase [Lachnospiraceae bacterium]|nr:HAD family hydrolase [Lachnospiraceae bacterium]
MKYDNYLFDLYGTLVDIHTEEDVPEVYERLSAFYGYYGAVYTPTEFKQSYIDIIHRQEGIMKGDNHEMFPEIQIEDVFLELFTAKGVKADKALAVHAGQFFRILSTDYIKLYQGARELLTFLKEQGKNVYLLSNAQRIFTEYEMRALGIYDIFDKVYISSDYHCKKPDIQFYNALLEELGLDPAKTIMIGNDNRCDIQGAQAVGLDTFYIHSNISPQVEDFSAIKSTYLLKEMDLRKVKEILTVQ